MLQVGKHLKNCEKSPSHPTQRQLKLNTNPPGSRVHIKILCTLGPFSSRKFVRLQPPPCQSPTGGTVVEILLNFLQLCRPTVGHATVDAPLSWGCTKRILVARVPFDGVDVFCDVTVAHRWGSWNDKKWLKGWNGGGCTSILAHEDPRLMWGGEVKGGGLTVDVDADNSEFRYRSRALRSRVSFVFYAFVPPTFLHSHYFPFPSSYFFFPFFYFLDRLMTSFLVF